MGFVAFAGRLRRCRRAEPGRRLNPRCLLCAAWLARRSAAPAASEPGLSAAACRRQWPGAARGCPPTTEAAGAADARLVHRHASWRSRRRRAPPRLLGSCAIASPTHGAALIDRRASDTVANQHRRPLHAHPSPPSSRAAEWGRLDGIRAARRPRATPCGAKPAFSPSPPPPSLALRAATTNARLPSHFRGRQPPRRSAFNRSHRRRRRRRRGRRRRRRR